MEIEDSINNKLTKLNQNDRHYEAIKILYRAKDLHSVLSMKLSKKKNTRKVLLRKSMKKQRNFKMIKKQRQ